MIFDGDLCLEGIKISEAYNNKEVILFQTHGLKPEDALHRQAQLERSRIQAANEVVKEEAERAAQFKF